MKLAAAENPRYSECYLDMEFGYKKPPMLSRNGYTHCLYISDDNPTLFTVLTFNDLEESQCIRSWRKTWYSTTHIWIWNRVINSGTMVGVRVIRSFMLSSRHMFRGHLAPFRRPCWSRPASIDLGPPNLGYSA